MDRRVVVLCQGLYIKKTNGRYREVISLEFLSTESDIIDENTTLNPIVTEDMIPQSLPGDAIKIYEQKLPINLLDVRICFESLLQRNLEPFLYKGKHYIFVENILNMVIAEREA